MSLIHLTVSEFNQIMTDIIQNQLNLNQLCISGDITQLNYYSEKKHLYLTLSHNESSLQCVIYNQHLKKLPVIKKGDSCQIIGQCRYLKNKGQMIFSGVNIIQKGLGNQLKESEKVRKKLEKEGLFDQKVPTDIPEFIEHVCIITSNGSAAHHDIESILQGNDHTFKTTIIPATMQGLIAPNSIEQALKIAEAISPDIICISRGGGAEQDFACYNDEYLTRIISGIKPPVLAGIGHQINTTFTCLAANQHFETPTAMAQFLCYYSMNPFNNINDKLSNIKNMLQQKLDQLSQSTQSIHHQLQAQIQSNITLLNQQFAGVIDQLALLNPVEKLKSGYVYCSSPEKKPITSVQQLKMNDTINLTFWNGNANVTVKNVNKKRNS